MKADSIKTAAELPPRQGEVHAFTLVEIIIVVFIIGLLAAIAIPSFLNARRESRRVMCVENMRVILQASHMYEMHTGKSLKGVARKQVAETLFNEGYAKTLNTFECPVSTVVDNDDYTLIYDDGNVLTDVKCTLAACPTND